MYVVLSSSSFLVRVRAVLARGFNRNMTPAFARGKRTTNRYVFRRLQPRAGLRVFCVEEDIPLSASLLLLLCVCVRRRPAVEERQIGDDAEFLFSLARSCTGSHTSKVDLDSTAELGIVVFTRLAQFLLIFRESFFLFFVKV